MSGCNVMYDYSCVESIMALSVRRLVVDRCKVGMYKKYFILRLIHNVLFSQYPATPKTYTLKPNVKWIGRPVAEIL